ncbi:hypothetical protein SLITO_v1c08850 [Spiroplasma litorale]|uniref:Probable membrane transporter protein n=1 Tax=Spiroplasma litorale TaxID=216942 RepID=A0A0K1W2E2_9MOLU|nr:sulfite exporter TauE/SafE family protein [Spiroplasma litorale]AKX34500.1 hypothetical protein SLITO_v1c08850 [Spiroplasma litorale]
MDNKEAIKIVSKNENDLQSYIKELYTYSENKKNLKSFYKEQMNFLKKEYKNKNVSIDKLDELKDDLTKLYVEKSKEIDDILNCLYTVALLEYENSIDLKQNINYVELKQEYLKNRDEIINNNKLNESEKKVEKKQIKRKYVKLKKNLPSKIVALIALVTTPLLLVISLAVNYLYYFERANNGVNFSFKNANHLIAFITMIIGCLLIIGFLAFMLIAVKKRIFLDKDENIVKTSLIGTVGSFTDTIGVGSFAVTVAMLNATDTVKDVKNLPGTLNIGLTIPNLFAGTLFVSAIEVELTTLISLIIATMLGAFCSAKVVGRVNKAFVAIFVAICLSIAGILMLLAQLNVIGDVSGSVALPNGLHNWKLLVGLIGFFIIGGLQSFGVGLYAPALAIISLLGMNIAAAFPIMTCAAGFALPTTAWTFHRDNNYNPKVSFGLTIGGVFGTVIAFFIVFVGIQGGLNIDMADFTWYLKWFAIAVMYYAAFMLVKKFIAIRKEQKLITNEVVHTINYFEGNQKTPIESVKNRMNEISFNSNFDVEPLKKLIKNNNLKINKW